MPQKIREIRKILENELYAMMHRQTPKKTILFQKKLGVAIDSFSVKVYITYRSPELAGVVELVDTLA